MLSIIIPTHNEEKAIGDSLARLKGLTLPHEVVVTDDASTDRTVEIARQYADQVLVPPAKHPTIAANRNAGAQAAKGDMLVFMDTQSDIGDPNEFFGRALADFEKHPEIVALTGALWVRPDLETFTDHVMYTITNWVTHIKCNVMKGGEANGKFQMMPRTAFDKVGGFREDLVTREDGDMFNRLSKIGRTMYDKNLKVFHLGRREHALGWPRLLWIWMSETLWFALFDKNITKTWSDIR